VQLHRFHQTGSANARGSLGAPDLLTHGCFPPQSIAITLRTRQFVVYRFGFTFVMAAVCLFAVGIAACQDVPSIRLLPTDREAARVRVLTDALDKHRTDAVPGSYMQLKAIVQDFVIRQLDAAPAISDAMLREQLQKVIGRTWADAPDSGLYVSSAMPWGPRSTQRLWAVAYAVWLGTHGPGGTGVVIDSYVWEPGGTRLAGRQDSDSTGYSLKVDWLFSGPDKVSLLAYGGMSGSNGLGNWKASVYFCDKQGVHRVWQTSDLHGLTAVGRGQLITLWHARPCPEAASSRAAGCARRTPGCLLGRVLRADRRDSWICIG
jgi:hypothetical protein